MIKCPFIDDYESSVTQKNYIYANNKWYPLKEIKLFDNCYNDGNVIGSAASKELVIKIDYEKDLNLKEFELHLGTNKGLIKIGNFIVVETKEIDNANSIEIVAYDYMIKSNVKYISSLDYSSGNIKIKDVLIEALKISGLVLDKNITSFPNSDFIVDSNQFTEDTLCRQVIIAVAQISGCIAKITSNNIFTLINLNKKTKEEYVLSPRYYSKISKESIKFKINTVTLGSSTVEGENITKKEINVTKENEQSIVILDNPFAYTQEKRMILINELFKNLVGFTYVAFKTEKQQGLPFLEVGDKIIVKDSENNSYNSYVLRIEYQKGINSYISAPGIIKSEVKYEVLDKEISRWKNTEIKVDKANQKINAIVTDITDVENKVAELNLNKNEINLKVQESLNKLDKVVSKNNELTLKVDGLTNVVKNSGGTNLIMNSSGQFNNTNWLTSDKNKSIKLSSISNTEIKNKYIAKTAFLLSNEEVEQSIEVVNGEYTLSFCYKKLLELADCRLSINEKEITLNNLKYTDKDISINVTTNSIKIKMISDSEKSCIIGDLMLVKGNVKQVYTINENESVTNTVKINDKIEVNSITSEISASFDNDGIRIKNANNGMITSEFTKEGTKTEEIIAQKGNISGLLVQNVNNQIWFS